MFYNYFCFFGRDFPMKSASDRNYNFKRKHRVVKKRKKGNKKKHRKHR